MTNFQDTIRAAGLEPPDVIEPGKFHRFPGTDKSNGNTAGWCYLFEDGLGGCFGDWSSGLSENWQEKRGKPLSQSEQAAFRRRTEEARKRAAAERPQQYANAAAKAAAIWKEAEPANDGHPYLVRKNIKANGARLHQGALVIPVRSGNKLHSLQFIAADGGKRFLRSGRIGGGYFSIGSTKGADTLCIVEGFATSATIHQATDYPVAVAFNAGNLEPVAKALRQKLPDLPFIICADDDADTKGNPGITKANQAALAIGGKAAVPDFGAQRPEGVTDFNDMAALLGLEAVARAVRQATAPNPAAGERETPVFTPEPGSVTADNWRQHLRYTQEGNLTVRAKHHNTDVLLAYHDEMRGVLGYNEFRNTIEVLRKPPWFDKQKHYPRLLADTDTTGARVWLEIQGVSSPTNVHEAVVKAAEHNSYDPLKDHLNGLT